MPSAMPCVSWKRFGPFEKSPQKVPMIEFTACPPSAGKPSTSSTFLPSAAASSAAEMPEIPAPSTQISAAASQEFVLDLRTVRMGISFSYLSAIALLELDALLAHGLRPRVPLRLVERRQLLRGRAFRHEALPLELLSALWFSQNRINFLRKTQSQIR